MIKALKQSLSFIIFSSNLAMNIKTALYVISLSAFATLQCADNGQLRAELAAKEAQLKKIEKEIEEQNLLYERTKTHFIELRDRLLEKRKHQNTTDDSRLLSEFNNELDHFLSAYKTSKETNDFLLTAQFFCDFAEDTFLKFYIVKAIIEFNVLKKLISQWEVCAKELGLTLN